MGVLIDTNIIIDLERGAIDISRIVRGREEEDFFISVISASELLYGVHKARELAIRSKRDAFVESVLRLFPILPIDLIVARIHSELVSSLETSGKSIGIHDAWIAATCLAHDLTLATGNIREFKQVKGLRLENWKSTGPFGAENR